MSNGSRAGSKRLSADSVLRSVKGVDSDPSSVALVDMQVAEVEGELLSRMEKLGSLVTPGACLWPAVSSQAIGLKG